MLMTPTATSSSPSPSPPPSFTTAVATPTTPPQQSTVPETSQITIPPCVVESGSKVALDLVERRESSRIKSNQAAKTSTLEKETSEATTASSQPPNKGKKRKKSSTAKRRGTTEIGARVESDDDDDEESLSSGDSSSDDSSDGSGDDHDDHADDDGDVTIGMSEEALMAHCKDLMCNPDFLGDEYIKSRDFNKNSPPADFIKGDDKHYVFPFLFCDPSGRARKKMPKHCEQDLEYVKSSALCRYINKLCGEVIARQKVKAEFVTKRGTTEDVNKIFKPIRNNIMHKREDGKRQFTIIDLTEPENLEFKNFLINVKNLMIKTGAVPADCFPTSDGGDDQITLIVQLGRAMQQHFHFDFNPELYKPHRNRRRQKRMQYKEFNGLSMFLNPSWVEQTLDLPDIDHTTKSHKQLYNTPISLMLMNGNQAHAGSPNDTDEDIWKFFWYVRPSDYVEDDETFLFYSSTCEYFPIAQAINERNHRVSLIEK